MGSRPSCSPAGRGVRMHPSLAFRSFRWWPEVGRSVEFMFAELPSGADRRMGLIVTTGYRAGPWMVFLPDEAYVSGRPWAVSASWLRDNWTADVYAESDTEKIQVRSDSSPSRQHALS
ncbi:Imm45 family immunity protein [Streptomyces sp. NPDC091287]|uniref:Imm45 family immunity protein n=1 Tax=Streptomyces sp. NPDC091287 TaxID=3365988 RepID=UPI00380A61A0